MKRRVLLVDDEVSFLFPMRKMMEGAGLAVDVAETHDQAMGCLARNVYDAVIADVRLGGALSRQGLEILEHVKEHLPGTQVIIMTGFGGPDIMKEAYRLNANYYFEKPVSFSRLSTALNELGVTV